MAGEGAVPVLTMPGAEGVSPNLLAGLKVQGGERNGRDGMGGSGEAGLLVRIALLASLVCLPCLPPLFASLACLPFHPLPRLCASTTHSQPDRLAV
jgi:hypothetical protein